jgi:hypothetical protein
MPHDVLGVAIDSRALAEKNWSMLRGSIPEVLLRRFDPGISGLYVHRLVSLHL